MSVSIQTPNGLFELSGKITKEKLISILGYTPADSSIEETVNSFETSLDAHRGNATIHVTAADKARWDNSFSGNFSDLVGCPISTDEDGNFIICDEAGNIIARIDADGLETTTIKSKTIIVDGKSLADIINELSKDNPNILDDESDEFVISDPDGHIIFRIDSRGLETTDIKSKTADVESLSTNNIIDEEDLEYIIVDGQGNKILQIDSEGLDVTAVKIKGSPIEALTDKEIEDIVNEVFT